MFVPPLPHQQDHKRRHLINSQTSKRSLSAVVCLSVGMKEENDRRHSAGNLLFFFEIIDEKLHFSKSKEKKVVKGGINISFVCFMLQALNILEPEQRRLISFESPFIHGRLDS